MDCKCLLSLISIFIFMSSMKIDYYLQAGLGQLIYLSNKKNLTIGHFKIQLMFH